MKLTFDRARNVAYIRLAESPAQVESVRVSDELNIDMTADGRVYGFELLNANAQLQDLAGARLFVENQLTGETLDVSLP